MPVKGLLPETTYCYQLVAVRGGLKSVKSDEKCARTDPAPATPTPALTPTGAATASASAGGQPPTTGGGAPSPGGGQSSQTGGEPSGQQTTAQPGDPRFANGKWIAVPYLSPENPAAEPALADLKAKLDLAQLASVIIRSSDFPAMKGTPPIQVPSLLLAVGPFDTQEQAAAACPQIKAATGGQLCLLYQPQP